MFTVGSPVKGTKIPLTPSRDIRPENAAGFTGDARPGPGSPGSASCRNARSMASLNSGRSSGFSDTASTGRPARR